jgi:hypothetical protein
MIGDEKMETIDQFEQIGKELVDIFGVAKGSMFGHKGFKIGGKFFAFLNGENFVVKLNQEEYEKALSILGTHPFSPMGKPMKEWIELPNSLSNEWFNYSIKAKNYVNSLSK